MTDKIQTVILIGRPAAGKSEVIDYLKKADDRERMERFHVGPFEEIDDFPFVWETFEIDDIYAKHGKPRMFTDEKLYFKDDFMWTMFLERINLEFEKKLRYDEAYLQKKTAIIEFSRGGETAYHDAFNTLSDSILSTAGIVYINVSYQESVRKNRRRFKPDQADSILFHSLPDEKMDFYYKTNDFEKVCPEKAGVIEVRGHKVPYSVLDNEPEVTNNREKLGNSLDHVFATLWKLYKPLH